MVIINWKLRPKGDRVNPYVKYKNDPNLFSIKVNHGGGFSYVYGPKRTRAPRRVYKGGNADWFDDFDADGFSVIEVSGTLKELGYDNPNIKINYKKPTSDLDKGLEPLLKDIDVLDFLTYVKKFKLLELFIEHPVDKCVIDESVIDVDGLDNDNVDGLESSNAGLGTHENEALDNDNVDSLESSNVGLGTHENEALDNDNVDLETDELKQTNKDVYDWLKDIPPQHWARSHFSGKNSISKAFEVIASGNYWKPIITCLEFIREYLMKKIVIVQKVIGKSKGTLTLKATKIFELIKKQAAQQSISWNGGILYQSTGQYGEQCVVNVEDKSCSCRKWDLTGIPCKHAVAAIWNMSENGLEPGIPETWVHESYWLTTWEEMYRFKINPCNGPDLWPPSDSPITLTPPDYHTPIGRPPKKRKKSDAELYDNMVKDGKLSRVDKTVTCNKCGQKGHNSRSCKGQRGPQSTGTPMTQQGASQSTPTGTPMTQQGASQSAPHVSVNPSGQSNVTQSAPVRYSKATANKYSPVKNNASREKRKVGE
ncbi:transposase, MuDR [Tanacetum coccineum]